MLFRKKMEAKCVYCKRGSQINDREVVCPKKGVVELGYHCRSFSYDPFKRVPPRPVKLKTEGLSQEEFTL